MFPFQFSNQHETGPCPMCDSLPDEPHHADCRIDYVLRKAAGEIQF